MMAWVTTVPAKTPTHSATQTATRAAQTATAFEPVLRTRGAICLPTYTPISCRDGTSVPWKSNAVAPSSVTSTNSPGVASPVK